jgi:xanthine dehydrogenase molybdenum-binding subunit
MKFILNGIEKIYQGDPNLPLLTYLREYEGIISPKDGCAPQAACGCCAVELNRKAVLSCVIPMQKVEGGIVTTIEGITAEKQEIFANAFLEKGGVQCGFCIPGFVMQGKVFLDHNTAPERQEVEKALTPNLCRCTGYKKIIDSILYAAEAIREQKPIPKPKTGGKVGARLAKYDSFDVVLGRRPYVDDIKITGMLHGALKFSDFPRARVLAIDVSEAEKQPGVLRIVTAKDIPGERYTGLIVHDWPLMIAVGEETRYIGDVIAGVIAENEETARKAVDLIKIEYEVLEPVTEAEKALQPGAPKIHPKGNLLSETVIKRGDTEKALSEAAYISRGVYRTQTVEHGFMEPECPRKTG